VLVEYRAQIFSDKYYFISRMPTEKGISGAPLIVKDDKNLQIVGLHGKKITGFVGNNAAIKLRREMFEELRKSFK
jgi:hypothetical protein